MNQTTYKGNRGVTLIELLVVMIILGLIAIITLSLYAIHVARDNSPPEPDIQSDERLPS